jgi:hypothetical protein
VAVKALSVRQPWAELIIAGRKTYEIRTWRTSLRGRIWIHAARTVERPHVVTAGLTGVDLPTGAVIGSVEIVDCVPFIAAVADELRRRGAFYDEGSVTGFAWRLAAPRRLARPIPYRGSLGFFRIAPNVTWINA